MFGDNGITPLGRIEVLEERVKKLTMRLAIAQANLAGFNHRLRVTESESEGFLKDITSLEDDMDVSRDGCCIGDVTGDSHRLTAVALEAADGGIGQIRQDVIAGDPGAVLR